jgi:hypothetical protein
MHQKVGRQQGDQIGRSLAHWAIVYIGIFPKSFFVSFFVSHFWLLFQQKQLRTL